MNMRLFIAIIIAACLITSSYVFADEVGSFEITQDAGYVKAQIYFYNWGYISDRLREPSETRSEHSEYIEITKSSVLTDFVNWLQLGELTKESKVEKHQAVFVIDLTKADGSVVTYYSNGCKLYSADFKYSRAIDSTFRKQFDYYGDQMIVHTPKRDYVLCAN